MVTYRSQKNSALFAKVIVIADFPNYIQKILDTKSNVSISNPYNALIINNIIEIVPNYLFSYYILFLSL